MFTRLRAALIAGALGALLAAPPAVADTTDEPLARFEGPICPGVAGLKVEEAEAVVARIRENLEGFGRRLAPPETCEANLIVAFVTSGQAYLQQLKAANRWAFTEFDKTEQERLLDAGPARAVLRVRPRSRDGQPIGRHQDLVDIPQTHMWMAHSKIYTATRNDIDSALVLIDRSAARGKTLAQLADYATFRALTKALPETAEARSRSIFSLFDGSEAGPAGLTAFDLAYLGTLYEGQPNIPGSMRELALEQATGVDVFRQ